jgi:hypothetical protein
LFPEIIGSNCKGEKEPLGISDEVTNDEGGKHRECKAHPQPVAFIDD